MFNSGMLDVAVGLIFIYLLLSLVCTAISEIIEAKLKMRASELERGIRELLHDPNGTGLVQKLYNHPLVYSLFQGDYSPNKINAKTKQYESMSQLPAYIPTRNFALALMDIVLPATSKTPEAPETPSGATGATAPPPAATTTSAPLKALRDAIPNLKNEKVERALLTLIDAAGNDVGKVRENIESWYDSTMDRVSGWYKRRAQWIVFGLGLGLAIAINADTITIANSLSHDVSMRNALVAATSPFKVFQHIVK